MGGATVGDAGRRRGRAKSGGAAAPAIPVFTLYGETDGSPDVEFMHIEPLSARGERHNWEFDRHTHKGLFQVLFVFDKSVQTLLDNQSALARAPCVIVVPPGVVHAFTVEPGAHGYVLTIAAGWSGPRGAGRASLLLDPLLSEPGLIELAEDAEACRTLVELLMGEMRDRRAGHGFMSEWLAACVLTTAARRRAAGKSLIQGEDSRAQVFARFRLMVEDHFAEHWPVSRYAQALATSESRLDRICRSMSGRSAFEIVQGRVVLEARRRLVHVGASVSALAYELGFDDPAYFCRFFKRHVGRTPSQWRREQRDRLSGTA